ncbi:DUF5691 domain-containing protein [Streptomyces echinatus]|uniref:DUF5691 domain-containing protein n=1 Tax=Streptomyces echinatus TaxID=67293 RepID=UPI003CD09125
MLASTWRRSAEDHGMMFLDTLRTGRVGHADESFLEAGTLGVSAKQNVLGDGGGLPVERCPEVFGARRTQWPCAATACVAPWAPDGATRRRSRCRRPPAVDHRLERDDVFVVGHYTSPEGRGERSWWLAQLVGLRRHRLRAGGARLRRAYGRGDRWRCGGGRLAGAN